MAVIIPDTPRAAFKLSHIDSVHSSEKHALNAPTTYRPDIDGLRTIAVLSVMIYHLHGVWLPGGFVGVDVFFVISGFVVTASLAGSRAGSFWAFLGEFYARRLARILPALVIVLIISAIASTLFIPAAWLSGFSEDTAKHAFFGLSNWVMQSNSDTYFAPRAEFNPYTHTWSLGVEEQFYVLAPFLVYLWVRAVRHARSTGARIAIWGLAVLTAASIATCIWASTAQPTAAFYFIGCRLWELAFGALLFLATYRRKADTKITRQQNALQQILPWIGLVCLAIGFVHTDAAQFPWPWALLPAVGTVFIIAGAPVVPTDMVRRTLAAPAAVWIGKRSYSLYLWHWPVYVLMRWTVGLNTALLFTIAFLATFVLAILSYRWIERPLRHNAWIEKQPKWLRISGFMLLPIFGFLAVTHVFEHRARYSLSNVARSPVDWYANSRMPYLNVGDRQCQVEIEYHDLAGGKEVRYVPKQCRDELPSKKMHVLGDSHAGALAPILEQLSAEQGIAVSIYSFAGCPFIDLRAPMDSVRPPGCLTFNRAVTTQTLAASKAGDIVFLPSLRMERYGSQWANFNVPDMYAVMYRPEAMALRQAALEDAKQWLQPFADKQLEVLFIAPTPVFKAPPFRCSDWFNHMNPICVGHNQQPRADFEALRKPIVESMRALGQIFPNVRVWDPFPLLCPDAICLTHRDGRPLFFDGDHLSAYGNLVLYPAFERVIVNKE